MNNYKSQIQSILENIRMCYIERNPTNIEPLGKLLFDNTYAPIIIGTSNNEWCFGIDECKGLFLSDWDSWGNVTIDMPSLTIGNSGTFAWFYVKAGLEDYFEDSEERYTLYVHKVQEIAKSTKSSISKTGEITWLLSHLLHSRKLGERKYIWDITITGMLQNVNDNLKIKVMQFSMPVNAAFPDVRIDANDDDAKNFEQECMKIREFNNNQMLSKNDLLTKEISFVFNNCNRFGWVCDDIKRFIGTDGIRRNSNEFINYIIKMNQSGVSTKILPDNIIVEQVDDNFCFCGIGTFIKKVSLDCELQNVLDMIGNNGYGGNTKEALFRIRRDLTHVLKEASLSDECISPFRIEGMGSIIGNKMYLDYMQISYPFNCLLEQKTDYQVEI